MSLFDAVSNHIGDDENLNALSNDLGADVVTMLLSRAEETIEEGIADIKGALDSRDSIKVREVAHSLKGASGSLYALKFSEMAAQIEKHCDAIDDITKLFPDFQHVGTQTIDWWKSKLG